MRWFRRTPLEAVRWVVLDCETSGLDLARDRLLSVGAVAVSAGEIRLADCFSALVAQATPSGADNILIHGIGGDAQRSGRPLAEVAAGLRAYVGEGVPVGFHAPFDAGILRRHGVKLGREWIDLATLMPALFPQRAPRRGTLDQWLAELALPAHARHDALGDAFASAQLLLVALAEMKRRRFATVEEIVKAERGARWLARH
jgi:DNA polymerase-3 subunit epsilon